MIFAKSSYPLMRKEVVSMRKLKIAGAILSILFGIFGIVDGASTIKEDMELQNLYKRKED